MGLYGLDLYDGMNLGEICLIEDKYRVKPPRGADSTVNGVCKVAD
jgi:hypothetical protein